MMKNTNKNQKGFSLIETLIAVSILMVAIAGPLSLVQAGLFSSNHQRNQVTATYLAQEAFEFIKNVRDSNSYTQYNLINGTGGSVKGWLESLDSAESLVNICDADGCYVDPRQGLVGGSKFFKSVVAGDDLYLNKNTIGSVVFYSYETLGGPIIVSVVSPYKRTVFIKNIVDNQEVQITVKIEWKDGALDREYIVSENIYKYAQSDEI